MDKPTAQQIVEAVDTLLIRIADRYDLNINYIISLFALDEDNSDGYSLTNSYDMPDVVESLVGEAEKIVKLSKKDFPKKMVDYLDDDR